MNIANTIANINIIRSSFRLLVLGDQANRMQLTSPFHVLLDPLPQVVQVRPALHEAVARQGVGQLADPDAFVALLEVAQLCLVLVHSVYCFQDFQGIVLEVAGATDGYLLSVVVEGELLLVAGVGLAEKSGQLWLGVIFFLVYAVLPRELVAVECLDESRPYIFFAIRRGQGHKSAPHTSLRREQLFTGSASFFFLLEFPEGGIEG